MEWIDVPFGPLFPGLPGGLAPTFTLDGDTVVRAVLTAGAVARRLESTWLGLAADLPDRVAALDPLSPVAFRLLGVHALETVAEVAPPEAVTLARIGALERERAASHLNWLTGFSSLLGAARLAHEAAALQLVVRGAQDVAALARIRPQVASLIRLARRSPLLRRRLHGVGCLTVDIAADLRGPPARATGIEWDLRADDPAYRALGFAPVVRQGGDALARLEVRLAEIEQSLDLVAAAGTLGPIASVIQAKIEGNGMASIETARGRATLRLEVRGGEVRVAALDTPCVVEAGLVPAVAEGHELADALVAVASLDLSPWEIDR
jgi:Ni,Fe-hydrogenase III large subunit